MNELTWKEICNCNFFHMKIHSAINYAREKKYKMSYIYFCKTVESFTYFIIIG